MPSTTPWSEIKRKTETEAGGAMVPPRVPPSTGVSDYGRFEFDDKAKAAGSRTLRTIVRILAFIGLMTLIALGLLVFGVYKIAT